MFCGLSGCDTVYCSREHAPRAASVESAGVTFAEHGGASAIWVIEEARYLARGGHWESAIVVSFQAPTVLYIYILVFPVDKVTLDSPHVNDLWNPWRPFIQDDNGAVLSKCYVS